MTATPVDKTYTMLMVADMQRVYTFAVLESGANRRGKPVRSRPHRSRSAAGSPVQHASGPMSGFGSPKLLIPKAT